MRLPSKSASCVLASFLLGLAALAADPGEQAILGLWKAQMATPEAHAALAAAGRQAEESLAGAPLANVARSLTAWHMLKAGQTNQAEAVLLRMLTPGDDAVARAAGDMGRRWLTRLDREKVRAVLRVYYREQVQYPADLGALAKLPEGLRPPMKDRWDAPWRYHLTGFRHISGLFDQKYQLESATLGERSDLGAMLAAPYPITMPIKPVKVEEAGGRRSVQFAEEGQAGTIVLTEGTAAKGLTLVWAGGLALVLSDGDYWFVVPRPSP